MHSVLYFIGSPKETSDKSVGLVTWPAMQSGHQPLGSDSNLKKNQVIYKIRIKSIPVSDQARPIRVNLSAPTLCPPLSNQTDSRLAFLQLITGVCLTSLGLL